jgi:hypothetical protein
MIAPPTAPVNESVRIQGDMADHLESGAMTMYPSRGSSSSNTQQLVYNAWLEANREAGKTLDFIVDVTRNRASCHRGRRQISGQSASLNSGLQEVGADHGAGNCQ